MARVPWKPIAALAGVSAAVHGGYLLYDTGPAQAGHSATTLKYGQFGSGEDYFYNWDFVDQYVSVNNVDWPIGVIYKNNANLRKVADAWLAHSAQWDRGSDYFFFGTIGPCGKTHKARFYGLGSNDPSNVWFWQGYNYYDIKGPYCGTFDDETDLHIRHYADPYDLSMYSPAWGYYVIASVHYDHEENCVYDPDPFKSCDKWSGNSESAEWEFAYWAREIWGNANVIEDCNTGKNGGGCPSLENSESSAGGQIGDHIVENNGWPTVVTVP